MYGKHLSRQISIEMMEDKQGLIEKLIEARLSGEIDWLEFQTKFYSMADDWYEILKERRKNDKPDNNYSGEEA